MSERNDGGQAFPAPLLCTPAGDVYDAVQCNVGGMTLRDYFAGQALAHSSRDIWANHKFEDVAERAYHFADAMLKARQS